MSSRTFYTVSSADATPEIQEIEETLAPLMSAHQDSIQLDAALYWRMKTLHDQLDELDLEPEQRYLVERHYREMTHAGAGLDDDAEGSASPTLNQRLSTLTTTFEKNLLADTNDLAVVFDDAAELDGLTEGELSAAAQAAADRGLDGKWVVTLTLFTGHPYLATLTNRASRKRIMDASRARGSRGNEHDNREVLLEIVRLRAERAALLGYDSHAAYVTSDETAGSPEAVHDLLRQLAVPAARNARREQAALQAIIDAEPEPFPLEAHDWAFYTEKVRAGRVRPRPRGAAPVVRGRARAPGRRLPRRDRALRHHLHRARRPVGLPPRRARLRGAQRRRLGARPLRPRPLHARHEARRGVDELDRLAVAPARHAARRRQQPQRAQARRRAADAAHARRGHHALPRVRTRAARAVRDRHLPALRGHERVPRLRRVPQPGERDVDLLARDPRRLRAPRRHRRAAVPARSSTKLHASEAFNQGFATSEYLAASWLDQAWHSLTAEQAAADIDVAAFEASALADIGLDNPVVPTRYSSTYFAHVFSGGYSAGYYSYIWSEVLDADTVEWFRENGGLTRDERRPLPRPAARRRRLEGPARGLPRLPRAGCRHPAAAGAPRPRGLSSPRSSESDSRPSSRAKARVRSAIACGHLARRRSARPRRVARTCAGRGSKPRRDRLGVVALVALDEDGGRHLDGRHRLGLVGALVVRAERGADARVDPVDHRLGEDALARDAALDRAGIAARACRSTRRASRRARRSAPRASR